MIKMTFMLEAIASTKQHNEVHVLERLVRVRVRLSPNHNPNKGLKIVLN